VALRLRHRIFFQTSPPSVEQDLQHYFPQNAPQLVWSGAQLTKNSLQAYIPARSRAETLCIRFVADPASPSLLVAGRPVSELYERQT
jgi:hypothetical protein